MSAFQRAGDYQDQLIFSTTQTSCLMRALGTTCWRYWRGSLSKWSAILPLDKLQALFNSGQFLLLFSVSARRAWILNYSSTTNRDFIVHIVCWSLAAVACEFRVDRSHCWERQSKFSLSPSFICAVLRSCQCTFSPSLRQTTNLDLE